MTRNDSDHMVEALSHRLPSDSKVILGSCTECLQLCSWKGRETAEMLAEIYFPVHGLPRTSNLTLIESWAMIFDLVAMHCHDNDETE
jgi:hypothetical protein